MKAQTVTEWDVRGGLIYKNGQAIAAFHDYHLSHPNGDTVEQWEATAWSKIHRLAYGTWA